MDIAFVAIKDVYPARDGGQLRMAGLIEQLRVAGHQVRVMSPGDYPSANHRSLSHTLRYGPKHGSVAVSPGLARAVECSEADLTVVAISYLAPFLRPRGPMIVDFQNIERDRYASLAREKTGVSKLLGRAESLKARAWEPRVARRAEVALACTEEDAQVLRGWGASVLVVPHASDAPQVGPSGTDATVGYLASAGYGPNDLAGRWLVERVWPRVIARLPSARLRIFGRGTADAYEWVTDPSVTVVGEVDSVAEEIGRAAIMAGPVRSGAGAQLKVVTTLAHGRTMVVTPHTLLSVPTAVRHLVTVADDEQGFASGLVHLLVEDPVRHRQEAAIARTDLSWPAACRPLVEWVEGL